MISFSLLVLVSDGGGGGGQQMEPVIPKWVVLYFFIVSGFIHPLAPDRNCPKKRMFDKHFWLSGCEVGLSP